MEAAAQTPASTGNGRIEIRGLRHVYKGGTVALNGVDLSPFAACAGAWDRAAAETRARWADPRSRRPHDTQQDRHSGPAQATVDEIVTYSNPVPLAQSSFGVLSHYAFIERPRTVAIQATYRF